MLSVIVPPDFWKVLLDEADRLNMQPSEALVFLAIKGKECQRLCKEKS